jgi:muramoyltetrapeptide carboxypeptidase LdcA involved in peptidoglycan recycling
MPSLKGTVLFIEDDKDCNPELFDRFIQGLICQKDFNDVKGVVIGRFDNNSGMVQDKLINIIKSKIELRDIPIVCDVDFGHTYPMITFPIGGDVKLVASDKNIQIDILSH